jgi:hypothetical protein
MKRATSLAAFGLLLLACVPFALGADTWKGSISDSMCGAEHHGKDATKCTLGCVKSGSAYVFAVSKDKVLNIENAKDPKIAAELQKHAGHNVEVTGTMSKDGKSVKIATIKMPK